MVIFDIKRKPSEYEEQYIWRLGQAKDSGQLDMEWNDIAMLINKEFRGEDESLYRTEATYRKPYQQSKRFFESGVFNRLDEDSYLKELQLQKDAVYKERKQLYDQRREYRKLLTFDARADHLAEEMIKCAKELNTEYPLIGTGSDYRIKSDIHKCAVLCWSDWHYGMTTDNIWNIYNTEICKQRVRKMIEYTIKYLELNHIGDLRILMLGDAAHGSIHSSCRVQAEENTCDQLMHVAEIMAEAINELSYYVNVVTVYSCYGNHMRTVQDKNDSIHSDNMEKIIPWWMKQRLRDNSKVTIVESEYREFTRLNVFNYKICAVHGDLDTFKNIGVTVNTIFTKKFGETIDYTISGDKHHLEEFEQFGIESILIRSLCGTDDYANNKRLYSKPGQTLMIFNDDYGRESTYHIPLD